MAYNDCLHITELALQARASDLVEELSFNSRTGLDTQELRLPAVTFAAELSEPVVENMTNRYVTVAISIRTNMDDTTRAQHQDWVQQFLDLFLWDDLAAELSAANSDFTCLAWEPLGETQEAVDRSMVTTCRLRLHVQPGDNS